MVVNTAQRRFRGQTPDERRAERRERLIVAGLDRFGAEGFHAVGVRDVCAAAGLTERYFYESFANREALFVAVYERCVARVRHAIEQALSTTPPAPERLARAALGAFLGLVRDEPGLARVLLVDVLAIDAEVRGHSQQVMTGFSDRIGGIVALLAPDLGARGVDARLLGDALLGATVFTAMQWVFAGCREPVEKVVDHLVLVYGAVARQVLGVGEGT